MRVAALDLGSNTSLLLIADVKDGQIERVVTDETTVTKMGQGVHGSRRLNPEALSRVKDSLIRYRKMIDSANVDRIGAVATSAARDVTNSTELIEMGRELQIPIEIITGEQEARMTFRGALGNQESGAGHAVIDVGGGSTELVMNTHQGLVGASVNVGSVRLTDLFVTGHPISSNELAKAIAYAKDQFQAAIQKFHDPAAKVIGVAGTPTTLAALEWGEPFSESKVHGFQLTGAMVEKWIERLAPLSVAERERFPGLQPQRADVIVMGSVVLREAMRALKTDLLTVSVRGIRYGLAMELGK